MNDVVSYSSFLLSLLVFCNHLHHISPKPSYITIGLSLPNSKSGYPDERMVPWSREGVSVEFSPDQAPSHDNAAVMRSTEKCKIKMNEWTVWMIIPAGDSLSLSLSHEALEVQKWNSTPEFQMMGGRRERSDLNKVETFFAILYSKHLGAPCFVRLHIYGVRTQLLGRGRIGTRIFRFRSRLYMNVVPRTSTVSHSPRPRGKLSDQTSRVPTFLFFSFSMRTNEGGGVPTW